mmetsp:Transcript_12604/g.29648  ORF Transcript_12604/g.29648 Transcript_12604/m.29648 type:complete len:123 (+) Transcript_12604:636-1004(+)
MENQRTSAQGQERSRQVNAELRLETVRHACVAVLRECDEQYPELAGLLKAHFLGIHRRLLESLKAEAAALAESSPAAAAKLTRAAADFAAEVAKLAESEPIDGAAEEAAEAKRARTEFGSLS